MKQKIIELINRIYEEEDEDKTYNLIYELYLLHQNNVKKSRKIILEDDVEMNIKHDKIGRFIFNPKWKDYKKKKENE